MTDWHNPSSDGISIRPTARVLLLDQHDCTLLFCATGFDGQRFWFTPGGGAEPGESPEAAALRELKEETGLNRVDLEAEIWRRTSRVTFDGELREFRERWFLAHTKRFALDTSGFNQLERDTIVDYRWWSLPELRSCHERMVPPDLADRIELLLSAGIPNEPVNISAPW